MNPLAAKWCLDPEVVYLNHGAYGACPRDVLRRQQELRDELERQPVAFFERRYNDLLDEARSRLGEFLGADIEGLARVPNATTGVNTVLRGLTPRPGDELLVTDHAYNACRNALAEVARDAGATVVVAAIPFPLESPEQVVDRVLSRVTDRTTFALLDHVTSPTGLVLPVVPITRALEERGIAVMIDGAHVPGMLPLDLEALGASWYTGNGHKWICAPRGAAFLWARADRRETLRPLVISHGTNLRRPGRSRFHDEFDWTGTDDPTAFLSLPAALAAVGGMVEGGWPEVQRRNHDLVLAGRQLLLDALDLPAPAPETMIGTLAGIPLPELPAGGRFGSDPLQRKLIETYRIEVPIMRPPVSPRRVLRISAQLYNEIGHYELLAGALRNELANQRVNP
jgi:isopenicillin-N epimerase